MKKLVLLALAASTVAVATPAAAQSVTGTINLTGSVAPKCFVDGGGDTFGTTHAFGELAIATGTLRTDLATSFGTKTFSVLCTTANPTISVDSTALATVAPAATGYDNSIDFEASVVLTTTSANSGPFVNDSSNAALAATPVGSRLANGSGNIAVTTSNYRTFAPTDLLVASPTYVGSIVIVIAPGT
jgi:hypothetical protein